MTTIQEVINGKFELRQYSGNEYYKKEAEYTEALRLYLNRNFRADDLKALTKEELIDLIQICSIHRPIALHSLLNTLSRTSQFY